jgi:Tryptophan halogenase
VEIGGKLGSRIVPSPAHMYRHWQRFFTATTSTTRSSALCSHSLFKKQFVPCCDDDCCEFVESSTSAATPGSCDTGALCTGMCVSRKFLDSRAWNARTAIFHPRASTKFPQLIETIYTACSSGWIWRIALSQQTSSGILVASFLVSRDSQTRIQHRYPARCACFCLLWEKKSTAGRPSIA